ncbi:hypothetical protein A2331_02840 [Candidatus Falkowbacteria bacterium RIFOXYB2_FULL_34_18]|uniref:Uncharacterized protein n=1 Tax=Candidatus Falkowbacteria bacterium RIFOXYD2_FULL_34_120 TaxID=1798007 RepID=A0A1F5TMI7_9BACT|nr:MAG: hypothetical protein A2331_02840 [Candidatus Falkowbacteria bacterium RIFOXYB2_FULL_34_18]OGF28352.1 MAG: hypothetical protein A2500_03100 [Candidatus Falkowbacteria bacterium RIFOXYC12_FULL_34_55]OGF37929.1 MAG: hypothetical protein A2466_05985 [Candidatus Falkowbacteria bacterium RIFOXYC2_FULL_34_220]OGF39647.1 MAG: hypothetical protein A2515_07280 [Candidatus Falkowbacteria bacterium RIFOXYD12_FULL_34_57]OGF40086.1 MAG: hypothetical protein A2531_04975 [Candidatus Falkowbacteria bact
MVDTNLMDRLYEKIKTELKGLEGEAFEKKKREIIEEFISQCPEDQQGKLRKKQKDFDKKTPEEKLAYLQAMIPKQKEKQNDALKTFNEAENKIQTVLEAIKNINIDDMKIEIDKVENILKNIQKNLGKLEKK